MPRSKSSQSESQTKRKQLPTELKKQQAEVKQVAKPAEEKQVAGEDLINNRLPRDILAEIFTFFTVKEKATLPRVCKNWNAASSSDAVWKVECDKEGIQKTVDSNSNSEVTYKELYKKTPPIYHYIPQILTKATILDDKYQVVAGQKVYSHKEDAIDYLNTMTFGGDDDKKWCVYEIKINKNQFSQVGFEDKTQLSYELTAEKATSCPGFPLKKVVHVPVTLEQIKENFHFQCKDGVEVKQEQYVSLYLKQFLAYEKDSQSDGVSKDHNGDQRKKCIVS